MRCELESNISGVLKAGQLEVIGQNVTCVCGFVNIANDTAAAHGPLHTGLEAHCTVTVTRCA